MSTIRRLLGQWPVYLAAITGFIRCAEDRIAGTSVGTDNPGIVSLTFTHNGMPARMTGRLEVYSDRHNPLADSLPLAVFAAFEADTLRLTSDSLLARLSRASLIRSGHDTILSFNLLGLDVNGDGAFLKGLNVEYREDSLIAPPGGRHESLALVPLRDYRGFLQVDEKESISNYVSLFGTPYFTVVQNGSFILKAIVPGQYAIHWIPYDKDRPVSGKSILAPVYSLDGLLDTDLERIFKPGNIEDTIALPAIGPRPIE